jgi:hypothetical protein
MTLRQLIKEEVRKVLREEMKPYFDTTNYRTLNKNREPKPKQMGKWAFEIGGEMFMTPTAMTYADAQNWAVEKANKKGISKIRTMG